jgi:hypothetical protein
MEQIRNLEETVLPILLKEVNRSGNQKIVNGTKSEVADAGIGKARKAMKLLKWVIPPEFKKRTNAKEEIKNNLVNLKEAMKGLNNLIS